MQPIARGEKKTGAVRKELFRIEQPHGNYECRRARRILDCLGGGTQRQKKGSLETVNIGKHSRQLEEGTRGESSGSYFRRGENYPEPKG